MWTECVNRNPFLLHAFPLLTRQWQWLNCIERRYFKPQDERTEFSAQSCSNLREEKLWGVLRSYICGTLAFAAIYSLFICKNADSMQSTNMPNQCRMREHNKIWDLCRPTQVKWTVFILPKVDKQSLQLTSYFRESNHAVGARGESSLLLRLKWRGSPPPIINWPIDWTSIAAQTLEELILMRGLQCNGDVSCQPWIAKPSHKAVEAFLNHQFWLMQYAKMKPVKPILDFMNCDAWKQTLVQRGQNLTT